MIIIRIIAQQKIPEHPAFYGALGLAHRTPDIAVSPLFMPLFYLYNGPLHGALYLFIRRRLDNIVTAIQAHCLLCVLELCMRRQKYTLCLQIFTPYPMQKGQAVFNRHLNVAQQHIHRLYFHDRSRLCHMIGWYHLFKPQFFPVNT